MQQRAGVHRFLETRFLRAATLLVGALFSVVASGAGNALPQRANQPLVLRGDAGMSASITLLGATNVADGESPTSSSRALFRGGLASPGQKPDLEFRKLSHGVEDYLHFTEHPQVERVSYQLDLSGVAGLRLVEGTLELLDAQGTPRLRAQAPFVVDAKHRRTAARLSISGCRYSTSGVAPWRRPVVTPGAQKCRLDVVWGDQLGTPVTYPAVLDPAWVDASTMSYPRNDHAAVLLSTGKVLIAGGYLVVDTSTYTTSAELYDPITKTWAVTTSMHHGRARFGAVLLGAPKAGQVLAAASDNDLLGTAEVYDPATATWTDTGAMRVPRDTVSIALLGNGKALVTGGCTAFDGTTCTALASSSEVYDPATNAWTASLNTMSEGRFRFSLTPLADGRALATGGCNLFSANYDCHTTSATADVYDPTTNRWTATDPLAAPLQNHVAVALSSGKVLAAGGTANTVANLYSELYDPATNSWTKTGNLLFSHNLASAALLKSGHVLLAGSWGSDAQVNEVFAYTELYDETSGSWSFTAPLSDAHGSGTLTALADGRALMAGGFRNDQGALGQSDAAEVFDEASADTGLRQVLGKCGECAADACSDYVTACNADPKCSALYACYQGCSTDQNCLLACSKQCPAEYAAFKLVVACAGSEPVCQAVCPATVAGASAANIVISCDGTGGGSGGTSGAGGTASIGAAGAAGAGGADDTGGVGGTSSVGGTNVAGASDLEGGAAGAAGAAGSAASGSGATSGNGALTNGGTSATGGSGGAVSSAGVGGSSNPNDSCGCRVVGGTSQNRASLAAFLAIAVGLVRRRSRARRR